jgi:hypothetical protein
MQEMTGVCYILYLALTFLDTGGADIIVVLKFLFRMPL